MNQCKDLAVFVTIICIGLLSLVDSRHHEKGKRRGERSQNGNLAKNNLIAEPPTTLPTEIFLSENCTQVLAQTGTTPILHCEVGEIEDITDWALHIRFAGTKDSGLYECQASTHPPTSLFVMLQLVEARAEIHGAPEKFVMIGSSLKLTCKLLLSTEPPTYVFWYHEKRMINYDRERGVEVVLGRYTSDLYIAKAQKTDAGNYTCVPSNAQSASIIVHVLNSTLEEKPAAMQHGSKNASGRTTSHRCGTVVYFIVLLLCQIQAKNYDFR